MWFCKIPRAECLMSIPRTQQKLKETVMMWQLSENNFQVWSPKLDHFFSVLVELLGLLMFSLCHNILDLELLREETKEPVNLQGNPGL